MDNKKLTQKKGWAIDKFFVLVTLGQDKDKLRPIVKELSSKYTLGEKLL